MQVSVDDLCQTKPSTPRSIRRRLQKSLREGIRCVHPSRSSRAAQFKAGDRLQPTNGGDPPCGVRDGKTLTTDGPVRRKPREQLGRLLPGRGQGSRRRAGGSRRAFPAPRFGSIEVRRPIWVL